MTATPVGDYIRRRYPDGAGTTHWLGSGDDPGCCGGPHARCTYGAAFAEGQRAERERIRQLAITRNALYLASGVPDDGQPSGLMPFADLIGDSQ